MKRLKNLFLFKLSIFLIINLFFHNLLLLICSCLLLFFDDYKKIPVVLIVIFLLNTISFKDIVPVGYIERINSKYYIVNKILYKTKVYENNSCYEVGDLVVINKNAIDSASIEEKKYGILFINYGSVNKIGENIFLKYSLNRLNKFNEQQKSLFKKILFNDYVNDNELEYFIGYGFCFYYFISLIYKKNRKLCTLFLLLYILFFGFDIKLLLIIINLFLANTQFTNIDKLGLKIILLIIINKYLLLNYSILISLVINLLYLLDKTNYLYLSLLQSLFFNEIQIFVSFFFKYLIKLKILIFILTLLVFIFPIFSNIYLSLMSVISLFFKLSAFSIRGKIQYLYIPFILLINRTNYKYSLQIAYLTLLLILLTPLNNPFKHVSFIDVGQGDSILINSNFDDYTVLIDTGSSYNYNKLKKFLFKEGIYQIDYLIISHDDLDHSGNIENLMKDFKINKIIDKPYDVVCKNLLLKNIDVGTFENDNDNSLIYYTELTNLSFLFTGDISSNIERLLVNTNTINKINVLKASHHGSKTATSRYLVSNLLPDFAIISTNGTYNHPSSEVLNTLDSFLVKTLITKEEGNISFYLFENFDILTSSNGRFDIIRV